MSSRLHGASAAVLIGGESKRMGEDKASAKFCGISLVEHVVQTLRPLFSELLISARDRAQKFPDSIKDCKVVTDDLPGRGPALGIAAALASASNQWVFVVSCDVPFLKPELVEYLYSLRDGFDAVVPEAENGMEPMCAFYSKAALPLLVESVKEGRRSLKALLEDPRIKVRRVGSVDSRRVDAGLQSFKDIDTPEELLAMEKNFKDQR